MAWDDIQTWDDCITPTEFNNMVTYIKALYCQEKGEITFILYSDCSNETGQEFKFSASGDDSIIEGDDTSGQDLILKANTADTYPFIRLEGNAEIYLEVANDEEIIFGEGGNQFFLFDHSNDDSFLYGGAHQYDDLYIYANSNDTYPFIRLDGDSNIYVEVKDEAVIQFEEGGRQYFRFNNGVNLSILEGGALTGNDLKLIANSTDAYPYIWLEGDSHISLFSTADIIFNEQAEEMFRFKLNGAISEIWGSDDTGDDLYIYTNQIDNCSIIQLFGDSGISNKIKAGSIFDISTCSGEDLFEIVTTNPMHINHHCLEAYEFRLENRTSDPTGPTCVARIWFRTDL